MSRRLILIEHDRSSRGDRASGYFERNGVTAHWVCPAHGDELPKIGVGRAGFDAAIMFGGIQSANDDTEYMHREIEWVADWVATERPFLGLCLGAQVLARALGARVGPHPEGLLEYGFVEVQPTAGAIPIMDRAMHMYAAHQEGFETPEGAERLFTGSRFPNQGFRFGRTNYGFQFHPECTPDLMRRWMAMDPSELDRPGAHDRPRQERDSERFDPAMGAWFERFLERWVEGDT